MTFVVENNVPVAKKAMSRRRSALRTAITGLKVGQCVTVFTEDDQTLKGIRARVSGLVNGAKKDMPDMNLIQRTVEARRSEDEELEKAIRVWRVEPDAVDDDESVPDPGEYDEDEDEDEDEDDDSPWHS